MYYDMTLTENLYNLIEEIYIIDYNKRNTGLFSRIRNSRLRKANIKAKYKICMKEENYIRNNPPTYDDLVEFADFVFAMNKVFFYKNSKESIIYVTKMTKFNKKTIVFNVPLYDSKITITLKIENGDKVVQIYVDRNYGDKLSNMHYIVNQQIPPDEDGNETMMFHSVNRIVQNSMADLYKKYIDKAMNGTIYDFGVSKNINY